MKLTRRDVLKATSAIAGAMGLHATGLLPIQQALAAEGDDFPDVIWLQGQSCTGCSVSVLNSVYYTTIDDLLVNLLDLDFHPTVMASAGQMAVDQAEAAHEAGGYVLVVEGAIPTGAGGAYCELWPGMSAAHGVARYARKAGFIIGVGSCACFGGMAAGAPNPTQARGLRDAYGPGKAQKRTIKIPGCPAHPDWVVGTVAYILANGEAPALDALGRPLDYFQHKVHSTCPNRSKDKAEALGQPGCLKGLGCKGMWTRADCSRRLWNAGEKDGPGENWCVGAGGPCLGCTEPEFPDGMSPFYELEADVPEQGAAEAAGPVRSGR